MIHLSQNIIAIISASRDKRFPVAPPFGRQTQMSWPDNDMI